MSLKIHFDYLLFQDGLFFINSEPDLVKGYTKTILTPNLMEFERLSKAVVSEKEMMCPLVIF